MNPRTINSALLACTIAAFGAPGAHASWATVYQNDFETGADSFWSSTATDNSAAFTTFLGRFSNAPLTMTQSVTPGGVYRFTFDLYIIDGWQGDAGPHAFSVQADGLTLFSATFDNSGGAQSSPWSPDISGFDLGFKASKADSIYRSVSFTFSASSPQSVLGFVAGGLPNNTKNASWGMDNFLLEVFTPTIPTPGPQALASVGLIVLMSGRSSRARRKEDPLMAPA